MAQMSTNSIFLWKNKSYNYCLNPCPAKPGYTPSVDPDQLVLPLQKKKKSSFANSVDPDQLASSEAKPTDLDLHCLPFSI